MRVIDRTARLDGFQGVLISLGAEGGEWSADVDPELLIHLLQAAASGAELSLDDAGGVRRVVIRRCWYDAAGGSVRATYALSGLSA